MGPMPQVLPIDKAGSVLVKLRKLYTKGANLQPGYIRLEKVLTPTSTSETFTLGEGQSNGTKRPLENYLSQNDNFVPIALLVGIAKGSGTTDNIANSPIYTYPDLTAFPFAGEAAALEGIWNGTLSFKSDTFEVVNRMGLVRHRRVPQTQLDVATQASTGEICEGFQELDTVPVFEGKKRNEVIFQYANGGNAGAISGDPTTGANVLILYFYGFFVRNASEPVTINEAVKNGILL